MWQKGHQIRWQFKWVTKKSDRIFTKNCDKFGASRNVSPTLSPDWSQNSVNHQICHHICHQIPWGSYIQIPNNLRHPLPLLILGNYVTIFPFIVQKNWDWKWPPSPQSFPKIHPILGNPDIPNGALKAPMCDVFVMQYSAQSVTSIKWSIQSLFLLFKSPSGDDDYFLWQQKLQNLLFCANYK